MGMLPARLHQIGPFDLASLPLVYLDAIARSGGTPVAIPNDPASIGSLLPMVDGLLFMGGEDLDPKRYTKDPANPHNQPYSVGRDETELRLMRLALRRGLPILGICRGTQVLNVTLGGTLHQHLLDGITDFNHCQMLSDAPDKIVWHEAEFVPGSLVQQIFRRTHMTINSDHHQGVAKVGRGLTVTARARDGVVEALELPDHQFVLGMQWHPERIFGTHPEQLKPFRRLVKEAKQFSESGRSASVTS
jgi:putative glutamine amidotransferase